MWKTWQAVARILADPGTVDRIYELAGPGVYTLHDLIAFTLRVVGKRRLLMPVPFAVAEIQARLLEFQPSPPLTTSQVDLLKADSVASGAAPGFPASISGPEPSKMWCRPISACRRHRSLLTAPLTGGDSESPPGQRPCPGHGEIAAFRMGHSALAVLC
jgi:hypothetical protein